MRNRTADLLLTMETLCLLSYRGAQMPLGRRHQRTKIHTARPRGRIQWHIPSDRDMSGEISRNWQELVSSATPAPLVMVNS